MGCEREGNSGSLCRRTHAASRLAETEVPGAASGAGGLGLVPRAGPVLPRLRAVANRRQTAVLRDFLARPLGVALDVCREPKLATGYKASSYTIEIALAHE